MRSHKALLGERQDGGHLLALNARKPFNEVVNRGATLQILEQRFHWHSSATKHPRTAYFFR